MTAKNRKNPALIIFKREFKSYFTSPVAYIVTALFLIISGIMYFSTFFLNNRAELRQFFGLLPIMLSFFVPGNSDDPAGYRA